MSENNGEKVSLIEDAASTPETTLSDRRKEADEKLVLCWFTLSGIIIKDLGLMRKDFKSSTSPVLDEGGTCVVRSLERALSAAKAYVEAHEAAKATRVIQSPGGGLVMMNQRKH